MAILNLRTDLLTGADAGGQWYYVGPSAVDVVITGVNGGNYTTLTPSNTTPIPGGSDGPDDPGIDFCSINFQDGGGNPAVNTLSPGTYTGAFIYRIPASGGCPQAESSVDLVIQAPPVAGEDATYTLCEDQPAFILYNQLGGTPDTNGSWEKPDGSPIDYPGYTSTGDPTQDTFEGQLPGTYEFVWKVAGNATANGCVCADATATLTVEITAVFSAGTGGTVTVCS